MIISDFEPSHSTAIPIIITTPIKRFEPKVLLQSFSQSVQQFSSLIYLKHRYRQSVQSSPPHPTQVGFTHKFASC